LFGDISGHLPFLLADRLSPVNLTGLVAFWDTRHEILKVMTAVFPLGGRNDHDAVFYADIHLIADIKLYI